MIENEEEQVSGIKDVSEVHQELEQISLISDLISVTSIRDLDETTVPKLKQINPLTFHNFISSVEMTDKNKAKKIKEIMKGTDTSDQDNKPSPSSSDEFYR